MSEQQHRRRPARAPRSGSESPSRDPRSRSESPSRDSGYGSASSSRTYRVRLESPPRASRSSCPSPSVVNPLSIVDPSMVQAMRQFRDQLAQHWDGFLRSSHSERRYVMGRIGMNVSRIIGLSPIEVVRARAMIELHQIETKQLAEGFSEITRNHCGFVIDEKPGTSSLRRRITTNLTTIQRYFLLYRQHGSRAQTIQEFIDRGVEVHVSHAQSNHPASQQWITDRNKAYTAFVRLRGLTANTPYRQRLDIGDAFLSELRSLPEEHQDWLFDIRTQVPAKLALYDAALFDVADRVRPRSRSRSRASGDSRSSRSSRSS